MATVVTSGPYRVGANYSRVTTTSIFNGGNTSSSAVQAAFDQANAAYIQANASFNYANTISGGSAIDNVARQLAITADQDAMAAFAQANAAYNYANTISTTTIDQVARNQANAAYIEANSAYTVGVTGEIRANAAFIQANSAYNYANTISGGSGVDNVARQLANSAFIQANSAFAAANNDLPLTGGTITGNLEVTGNVVVDETLSAHELDGGRF